MRAELPLGTRDPLEVDGYRVVRRLAQGGQGVVYLARTPDDDLVALKLLHPGWLEEPSARERLVKEIGAARTVARFCVAQVLDAKVDGDTPYIVSEFVEGPSLSQHVKEQGPLRGAALDRLAVATATALAAIHRARIVHRDLKPSNVMLGPDGPRVIDFGIARDLSMETTSTGRIVGSPNYMSPEQLSGLVVGPPADVFSWGCTVVFAATGRSPFSGDTLVALMYQVVHADPDTDGVPEPLRGLVVRCLAKDPDARPTSEQVLLALLGGPGLPAAAPSEAPVAPQAPAAPADAAAPVTSLAAGAAVAGSAGLPDDPTPPTTDVPRAAPPPLFPPPPPPYRPYDAPPPPAPPPPAPAPPAPAPPAPAPPAPAPPAPAPPAGRGGRWALGALAAVTAGLLAVGGGLAVRDVLADDGRITGPGPSVVPQAGAGAAPVAAPTSPAGDDDPGPTTTAPPTADPEASATATPSPSATRRTARTKSATRRPSSAPAGTPSAEDGVPRSFAGVWSGTATQRGGIVTSFDVTMRLGRGADRGTIASATLGCTGVVDVVGTPTASVLRLHQRTTRSGDGLCALGADITMTKRSTNRAAWAWVDDTEPTNTASAVLTRP